MNHIVYYPFLAVDDKHTATSKKIFTRRYTEGNLVHTKVVWRDTAPRIDGAGPLKALMPAGRPDTTVLIIDCHGDGMVLARTDADIQQPERYKDYLTAEDLAKQLKLDELPTDHRWIKLNVCKSEAVIARNLAKALFEDGYKNVWVGGVNEDIKVKMSKIAYGCMICGSELAAGGGIRITGSADPKWVGDATKYFDGNGAPHEKLEAGSGRDAKPPEQSKHYCAQCKKLLQPKEVGERTVVEFAGRRRVTVVSILDIKKQSKFETAV